MDNNKVLKKTILVMITTIITMVTEIYFGFVTNSIALLADGFHMGTHAFAFLITLVVCIVAIKHKDKEEKLNALGCYTSAILLGLTSVGIFHEAIQRFIHPAQISFFQAVLVATIGLFVNALCILIMGEHHHSHHSHCDEHHCHEENLNFKAAYLHILADVLTSLLAIVALICAKYFNFVFLDPVVGLFSSMLILKWAIDLIKKSLKILL